MKICVGASFFLRRISYFMKLTKDFDFLHIMQCHHPKVSSSQLLIGSFLNDHSDKKIWAYTSGNWAQRIGTNLIKKLKIYQILKGLNIVHRI